MAPQIRLDGLVAVVTGAGGGLGRAHALDLASRGAKVVVNDLGGGFNGDGSPKANMADAVVSEIRAAGGTAIPDYHSVTDGHLIVETAVQAYGTVHILINNAGILRDVSFRNMTDKDWDLVNQVHMLGTFSTTRAAWPLMKAQKFGRIVNTASGAGTYGNFGQTNYCAAKAGIIAFTFALAREGEKDGITANVLAPIAASRLTQTVMPPDLLAKLSPEYVSPIVPALVGDGGGTGGLYELGGGCIYKFRWERSRGVQFGNAVSSPEEELGKWAQIEDFGGPVYEQPGPLTAKGSSPGAYRTNTLAASSRVLIIGPKTSDSFASHASAALKASGAIEIAHIAPSEISHIKPTHAFDIVIVDPVFPTGSTALDTISPADFSELYNSHSRMAYKSLQPLWPTLVKNRKGRVLVRTAEAGLYGAPGGAAVAASTYATVGFIRALFREGMKYGVGVNALAVGGPGLEEDKEGMVLAGAMAAALCGGKGLGKEVTGRIYCARGDGASRVRWQRSKGAALKGRFSAEEVRSASGDIEEFGYGADYPDSAADGMTKMLKHLGQGGTYAAKQAPKGAKI